MIGDHDAVAAARSGEGTECAFLPFRGARSSVATISDKDHRARLARPGTEENRAGGEASGLHPPDGEEHRADQPVPFVEADGKRDVLLAMPEQVTCELGCCSQGRQYDGEASTELPLPDEWDAPSGVGGRNGCG